MGNTMRRFADQINEESSGREDSKPDDNMDET